MNLDVRIYLVNCDADNDTLLEKHGVETIMQLPIEVYADLAEKQGSVYSLSGFKDAFNFDVGIAESNNMRIFQLEGGEIIGEL